VVAPLADVVRTRGAGAAHGLGPVLSYAGCGVVLLGAALGALGMVGKARGWSFVTWTVGTAVVGAASVAHAYALVVGGSAASWLEAVGPVGVTLVVVGATQAAAVPPLALPRERSMAVAAVSSACCVAVLAAGPTWSQAPLPSALALAALLGCGVRLGLVFLQLRELAAIREQALTDELTGAANRRAFHAELDAVLGEDAGGDVGGHAGTDAGGDVASAPPAGGVCVGLVDLDHFKEVNDTYGHAVGDELLRAVVSRFRAALQELRTPHLFARLGGDEFAVVLHEVTTPEAALACGEALQESLLEPVALDGVVLHAQASIGMALAPDHGRDRGGILFAADVAMYASKTSGEPVCIYSPSEDGDRRGGLEVAEDLFAALERGELTVEYQPITTVAGDLAGAEALVRWDHPMRGRLSPTEFLAVAEKHRLTADILRRVLDVALHDLRRWRAAGSGLRVSVNVTASDLSDEGLVGVVAETLRRHDVPAGALTIEVTEAAMMRSAERARAVMAALADLGVQLAVDAYGTGYSGLAYLLNLPVSEIKLDGAFAASLADDPRAVAIVRSAVELAHALGLRMVAEGVEDEASLAVLADLGCDLVQGWHVGRPVPGSVVDTLLPHRVPDQLSA
jgi:diguanylate cyclase (GGDEF)-like protein